MSDKEPIDWDALDADTQHELVSLAEKLGEDEPEQEAKRTASRREFLGAVTAAGLGGSLLSQGADKAFEDFVNPASAGTQSVAQFGEAGEPFDFVAEDIYGPGGQGSGDPVNFEQIGSDSNRFTGYLDTADANVVSTADSITTRSKTFDFSDYSPHLRPIHPAPGPLKQHPNAANPVLTGADASVDYVADPFAVFDESSGQYHLFFEEQPGSSKAIGHATSYDGLSWTYNQTVLSNSNGNAPAYPFVWKWNGTWYMLPDTAGTAADAELFSADAFPDSWSKVETLFSDATNNPRDPTPVFWNGRWYIFTYTGTEKRLYYADSSVKSITNLTWSEHPSSPIITGTNGRRNGGRPIVNGNYIDMFYQDEDQTQIRNYRVTDLSTLSFSQVEHQNSPILQPPDSGWNSTKIHHVDFGVAVTTGENIVIVDGHDGDGNWEIGAYCQFSGGPQSGTAVLSNGGALTGSPDDGWDTADSDTISVTFEREFSTVPKVALGFNGDSSDLNGEVIPLHQNVTTTGFEILVIQHSTRDISSESRDIAFDWVATEQS